MFAAMHMDERHKAFMKGPDLSQLREKSEKRYEDLRKAQRQDQSLKRRYQPSPSEPAPEDLPTIQQSIQRGGDSDLLSAATNLRKLLANPVNPPIQQVIDDGRVPALLAWMQRTDLPKLQFEACWAVINIASGAHAHAVALVSKGIIPVVYPMLKAKSPKVRNQAVWLIGNLAGDSAQIRDALLQSKCLPNILTCIQQGTPETLTDIYPWAVSNLCRGKPKAEFEFTACAVPYLCSVVKTEDNLDVLHDVLWALSHICGDRNERVQMLLDEEILEKIGNIVCRSDHKVQVPALRVIGNIAAGRESQTATILNLVPSLRPLLFSPSRPLQKEAAWIFSNIASGPSAHIDSLLASEIFAALVDVLPGAAEEVQKDIIWALYNAVKSESEEVAIHLIRIGVFAGLTHILEQGSPSLIYAALDVIKALLEVGQRHSDREGGNEFCYALEECGGLSQVDSLQYHGNQQIYEKAMGILGKYFEGESEMDDFLQDLIEGK